MAPRPPSDAVVALRSLGRRFRALFAGLEDDESPDDLAHRVGEKGRSAFDHLTAASRMLTTHDRALEQVLVEDDPALDPMSTDTHEREAEQQRSGSVEERISELQIDADSLAERADRAGAHDWERSGRLDDGGSVTASEILWDAVDRAVDHLRDAGRVIDEVRGR